MLIVLRPEGSQNFPSGLRNDYSGRGNRNLGFDVNSKLRPDGRQSYFQTAYEKAGGAARRSIGKC